eukprot:3731630-Prymnesium_polylepis.2
MHGHGSCAGRRVTCEPGAPQRRPAVPPGCPARAPAATPRCAQFYATAVPYDEYDSLSTSEMCNATQEPRPRAIQIQPRRLTRCARRGPAKAGREYLDLI